jgi:outer membrane protein TolC
MSSSPKLVRARLTGVATALLTAIIAHSAAGQVPVRLTLDELMSRIQNEHPVNRQSLANVNAAVARAAELGRIENPTVQYEKVLFDRTLYLSQPVRWPWEFGALRRLGTAQVQVARAEARLDLQAVGLAAAQRFVDGVRNRDALALAQDAESLAVLGLNRAISARQMGQGGDLPVLQARVTLDAARRERVAAAEASRASAASIAVVLGQPADSAVELCGALADLAPINLPDSTLHQRAVSADAELNRLSAQAEEADREAKVAKSRIIPELQVGPTFGRLANPQATVPFHNFGFIASVDLPLFHGQGDAIRAAKSDREASLAGQRSRERELAAQVLDASSTRTRVQSALLALRSGDLTRAAQAESLAVRALQQGGPYLTTWLATHEAYLDARRAELDLEWQSARARLMLRYLTGRLFESADSVEQR